MCVWVRKQQGARVRALLEPINTVFSSVDTEANTHHTRAHMQIYMHLETHTHTHSQNVQIARDPLCSLQADGCTMP